MALLRAERDEGGDPVGGEVTGDVLQVISVTSPNGHSVLFIYKETK